MVNDRGYVVQRFSYYECISKSRTCKNFLAYPQWNEDATCDKWRTGLQGGRRYRGEWRSMELQRTEWIDAPDIYVQNTVALEVSNRF